MDPVVCEGSCTVTLTVESAPLTEEKAADLLVIFWGFMAVLAVIWGLKKLRQLFDRDEG